MKVCELLEQMARYRDALQEWEHLSARCKSDNPPSRQDLRFLYCKLSSTEEILDEWLPRFLKGIKCENCKFKCVARGGVCINFEPRDDD